MRMMSSRPGFGLGRGGCGAPGTPYPLASASRRMHQRKPAPLPLRGLGADAQPWVSWRDGGMVDNPAVLRSERSDAGSNG